MRGSRCALVLAVAMGGCGGSSEPQVCTLIGCDSGLTVELEQAPAPPYTVEVYAPSQPRQIERCESQTCNPRFMFSGFTSARATIEVIARGDTVRHDVTPNYVESRPNGPACDPVCRNAVVRLPAAPAPGPEDERAMSYRGSRELDLTGDGEPDSVHVVAGGTLPDSVRVVLTMEVRGVEKYREEWSSSYELALVDAATRAQPHARSILSARLDSVLESVRLRRIGPADMRPQAEDSAALARLTAPPSHGVSFSYGYETNVRLAWDERREVYVRMWSCC